MVESEHKHDRHAGHYRNKEMQSQPMDHSMHSEHAGYDMSAQSMHSMQMDHTSHTTMSEHAGPGTEDTGHEQMFRTRFWGSLLLSIPVLLFSPTLQNWLGFRVPTFTGSNWIPFVFSLVIFAYAMLPFLNMAKPEIRNREPGMMTLISLAIAVAFLYSLAAQLFSLGVGFFWVLVTLIDITLLGHWLEMRSVRQGSGALNELAKLMPDDAELVTSDGSTKTVSVSELKNGDVVLVRPGANVSADGEVVEGESKPVDKGAGSRVIAVGFNIRLYR